ncbi:hypothetical protein LJK88_19070 [Paenibacillus sp. P26]|nr:hypothetical protein LJK88_19070 [Paenibacillus sp. P26]
MMRMAPGWSAHPALAGLAAPTDRLAVGSVLASVCNLVFQGRRHVVPETFMIVQLTLLVTLIFEHLPRVHWSLRGSLQLIAIVAVNVGVLESYGIIGAMPLSSFVSSRLFLNLYELTPYLWFGLGTWVLYLTVIWWVEVKWRIYVMMIVSVLALCIRDSFSSIFLWPQVAMMVGQRLVSADPEPFSAAAPKGSVGLELSGGISRLDCGADHRADQSDGIRRLDYAGDPAAGN